MKKGKNLKVVETVTVLHSIKSGGFNLAVGMVMDIFRVYFRNGEAQLVGCIDNRNNIEEIPAVWTNYGSGENEAMVMGEKMMNQ